MLVGYSRAASNMLSFYTCESLDSPTALYPSISVIKEHRYANLC